jgi:ATP-dependent helicase/DNAse subunit B
VLAAWVRTGAPWADIFHREWAAACRRLRVPPGYRVESIRLELLRNLAMIVAGLEESPLSGGDVERPFELRLAPDFLVSGTIDRLIRQDDSALVIDYKYTAPESIRRHVQAHEEGLKVQGGLYLIAAEEAFGLRPAGFLYCGTKKKVAWGGWHTLGSLSLTEATDPREVRELMELARAQALNARTQILAGRIQPAPADRDQCQFCDAADICRIDVTPAAAPAAGAAQ